MILLSYMKGLWKRSKYVSASVLLKIRYATRCRFWIWYTKNDNDMLSYSLSTMMYFLTKEWYGFSANAVKPFIKTYHRITYKEDLKVPQKRCVLEMICIYLWFWLWCAFYNRLLKKHIILLSKCTSRLADKRIHIKLVSSGTTLN